MRVRLARAARTLSAWLVLSALPGLAHAEHPFARRPQLVIDPGMHTAQINQIGVDRACTRMVTGSEDKTARLWALPPPTSRETTPQLLHTFRPPINPGFDGQIAAIAIDPDGGLVAASGWTPSQREGSWTIYLFDARTEEVTAVLDDNPARVRHLVFSRDGRYLAATMGTPDHVPSGVRVWRTGQWDAPVREDYKGYGPSHGADFDDAGRLYTVAFAERGVDAPPFLRRYGAKDLNLDAQVALCCPDPFHVAAQPGGDRIAVGLLNEAGVLLYRSLPEDLIALDPADTRGTTDAIGNVGWSSDGRYLFAGGSHTDADGRRHLFRRWDKQGSGKPTDFPGPTEIITHLLPCGDAMAWGARDPAFGLIGVDGDWRLDRSRVGPDLRETRFDRLLVSADGKRVGFPIRVGGGDPALSVFDLRERWPRLEVRSAHIGDLLPADIESLKFKGWHEGQFKPPDVPDYPMLYGRPVAPRSDEKASDVLCRRFQDDAEPCHRFRDDEHWRSLAIAKDGKRFVLGTEWWVRGYVRGEDGLEVLWKHPAPGSAWSLNVARDGRTVVAAYSDGTIRWHDMETGKERLALFVHESDGRWITWTPDGYFTASLGGEDLIAWHFNNGPNEAADVFPVARYRDKYARDTPVMQALRRVTAEPATEPGAKVMIVSPDEGATFDENGLDLQVEFRLSVPPGFTPQTAEIHFIGVLKETVLLVPTDVGKSLFKRVRLLRRDGHLSVRFSASGVVDGHRESIHGRDTIHLRYVGATPEGLPRIFGLVVGTRANYQVPNLLEYPVADALAFKAALDDQTEAFRDHEIRLLVDQKGSPVTGDAIKRALRSLENEVQRERGDKVTVFFYSGHGLEDNGGRFHLMPGRLQPPKDVNREEYLEENGVEQGDLVNLLAGIPGRKLLFLDACRSGNLRIASLANPLLASGGLSAFVYAATQAERNSEECKAQTQGCFTKAIVEALGEGKGASVYDPTDVTTTEELERYVAQRVPELTCGRQWPTMTPTDPAMPHFDVGHHR